MNGSRSYPKVSRWGKEGRDLGLRGAATPYAATLSTFSLSGAGAGCTT